MSAEEPGAILEALRDGTRPVRLTLVPGRTYVVGRGDAADMRISAEPHLSRAHLRVRLEEGRLRVSRAPDASNPVYHQGVSKEDFHAVHGEQFVVGSTRFAFLAGPGSAEPPPLEQRTLSLEEVHACAPSGDRLRLLDLLELPELLRAKSEAEFFLHVASLLRLAAGAAFARIATEEGRVLAEDAERELGGGGEPSRTLVLKALDEAPRPTLCRWTAGGGSGTVRSGVDWAVAAAARVPGEPALVFYAAGEDGRAGAPALEETARLVGLVADIVGRTLSVRRLEARERRLERFFPKAVIAEILEGDCDALEPRLTESTVMFFDIRGFSRLTEGNCGKILEHVGALRRAMTAMTEEIFRENGVVLKYMGDGLMACWNVPVADPRHVDRAARAALAMARRLGEVVPGWRCGIGLHAGEVVAGAIGSEQLFAYEVLGAVVNVASRVEGITKFVEAPVLASREVACRLGAGAASVVRLGRFQPAGMTQALDLFELAPPPGDAERAVVIGRGLDALEDGRWEEAYELLDERPAKDLPARFLKSLADRYRRHPPKHWRGVIELDEK